MAGISTYAGSISFQLADVPNASNFTQLFDQYRITAVKIEFILPFIPATYKDTTVVAQAAPTLFTASDIDDATAPASLNEILEKETVKCHGTLCPYGINKAVRWVKPAVAAALYKGTFTGYGSKQGQWIDANSSDVAHYGLKYWLEGIGGYSAGVNLYVYTTYYMEFKYPQ